jgi:isoeugenol monooxygenase
MIALSPTSSKFPDTPAFKGLNRPSRVECDIVGLEVDGELPADLRGSFYRCGPDPQFPPLLGDDIFINGDGVVSAFHIRDGRVDYSSRFVRTAKFLAERAAGRSLFGAYRNPYTDAPEAAGLDRTTANTSMLWHAGRLYALKEDGRPHRIDPDTLATLETWDFDGALQSRTFTAHPKTDPASGELVFFGYQAGGGESSPVAFGTAVDGLLKFEEWFEPPYVSMIHDWAVTQNHVVFPVMPVTMDVERMRRGGPRWAWDPSRESVLVVMPRSGDTRHARAFTGPALWSFHVMNAFEEGSDVHIDLCLAQAAPMPAVDGSFPPREASAQYLTRVTCALGTDDAAFSMRRLWGDMPVDFPEIDQRRATLPYRHGFVAARDPRRELPPEAQYGGIWFNCLAHVDHHTGEVERYYVGPGGTVQEPVFAPRTPDSEEGDGYLLAVVNHFPEALGSLLVFDTRSLSSGPVAAVKVPLFLRPTFHGMWLSAADRDASKA